MKLVGELKEQVEKAGTKAEAKGLIEKAGMLLTDEELDTVSGGTAPSSGIGSAVTYEQHECNGNCRRMTLFKMYPDGRGVCTDCGWKLL